MARSEAIVQEVHLKKANQNAYQDQKHMHSAKKVVRKPQVEKEEKIQAKIDQAKLSTLKQNENKRYHRSIY